MKLTTIHLISLIITLALTMLPGIIEARKIKSADDYNVGGRSSGAGMVAGAIIGTIVGGAATIGTAQMGFKIGLAAWWFTLGSGIALIIMALFYARPLRTSGLTTISEYLVLNYGKNAGPVASISSAAGIFFSIVASTLTTLHLIAPLFGVSYFTAAIIMVVIVMGFVVFGGLKGSGLSGIFKLFLIFASIFVGGFLAYNQMGALTGMHAHFEPKAFSLFGNGFESAMYSLASMIIGVISTQTYVQALFSAKDSKTAMSGCLAAAIVVIPVGLPSVVIGMYMRQFYPTINPIEALPMFLLTQLPEWLGGVGIAALLLSSVGSCGGLALGIGTMMSRDIFKALLHVEDSKKLLWINRACVLLATVLAIIFVFHNLDSLVLDWNYLSMALRGSGVFLPLTFAIFVPGRVAPKIGFFAMLVGVFVALTYKFFVPTAGNTLFPSLEISGVILLAGLIFGLLKK
ncbi:MAG: sodium:solute symporter family protein [Phascolarctobacterium sp.]|nr:sodium:solute symporter family protein [Phascolarctobacterium sp.]